MPSCASHVVALLAPPGLVAFEPGSPAELFERAGGRHLDRVAVQIGCEHAEQHLILCVEVRDDVARHMCTDCGL